MLSWWKLPKQLLRNKTYTDILRQNKKELAQGRFLWLLFLFYEEFNKVVIDGKFRTIKSGSAE